MNKTMAGITLAATLASLPAGAQAQDAREGAIEIEKCQTISQPGSYKLVNNLTFAGSSGACLMITASGVTLNLAGFTISGHTSGFATTTAILASGDLRGIAVQNGSVSGFQIGVNLGSATGSLVEKLRVIDITRTLPATATGIIASGIVKNNSVLGPLGPNPVGTGISATGTLTGNYVTGNATLLDVGRRILARDRFAPDSPLEGRVWCEPVSAWAVPW
jgi:hypothetical protein